MHIRLLLAVTTFAVAAAGPAAAQTEATGVWKAEFVTPDRVYPARLELKQDGDKITGSVGSETQSSALTGTAKGADIAFAFSTRDPNGADRMLAIDVKAS